MRGPRYCMLMAGPTAYGRLIYDGATRVKWLEGVLCGASFPYVSPVLDGRPKLVSICLSLAELLALCGQLRNRVVISAPQKRAG